MTTTKILAGATAFTFSYTVVVVCVVIWAFRNRGAR